jgi:hypothetical protein
MQFTADEHANLIAHVEILCLWGIVDVTEETTAAWMPRLPNRWGLGWVDRFVMFDHPKWGKVICSFPDGNGTPYPRTRRYWGLVRWWAKEGGNESKT